MDEIQNAPKSKGRLLLVDHLGGKKLIAAMALLAAGVTLSIAWGPDHSGAVVAVITAIGGPVAMYLGIKGAIEAQNGGKP